MTTEETKAFLDAATATCIAQLNAYKAYKDDSKQLWNIERDQCVANEVDKGTTKCI